MFEFTLPIYTASFRDTPKLVSTKSLGDFVVLAITARVLIFQFYAKLHGTFE